MQLPECVEMAVTECPAPDIAHARLQPSSGVEVGRLLSVTCEDGYELQGPAEVECAGDGTFRELPSCNKKLNKCPVPDIPAAIISPVEPIPEGYNQLPLIIFASTCNQP